jgi:two-component system, LytTR family, response regulator
VTSRVLVADDEPLARERIRGMLARLPAYAIVAECGDGASTVEAILRERPDILLLDIRMPELDGFEVLAALEGMDAAPAVVFTTAHSEYAVRAFEVRAADYLLKPFDRARFERALVSAAERRARAPAQVDEDLRAILGSLRARERYPPRFLVRSSGEMYFVRAADIDWVDAQGNYVRLHAAGRTHLVRDTMKEFAAKLDPALFVRIHRSAIVNIDRVARLEPYGHGEYVITLRDGTRLTSSRAHSASLHALLR